MPFAEWENSCLGYQREERFAGPALHAGPRPRSATWPAPASSASTSARRSCDLKTANFSGGNQQKIVIAREIERDPEVLLVGQPTRGVDIGAIEFIHQQIVALRDRGKAIVLVSVELDEIQALSDRILVMFDGRISGERAAGETDERELGLLMAGIDPERPSGVSADRYGLAAFRIALIRLCQPGPGRAELLEHVGVEPDRRRDLRAGRAAAGRAGPARRRSAPAIRASTGPERRRRQIRRVRRLPVLGHWLSSS